MLVFPRAEPRDLFEHLGKIESALVPQFLSDLVYFQIALFQHLLRRSDAGFGNVLHKAAVAVFAKQLAEVVGRKIEYSRHIGQRQPLGKVALDVLLHLCHHLHLPGGGVALVDLHELDGLLHCEQGLQMGVFPAAARQPQQGAGGAAYRPEQPYREIVV